ncbi:MAG: hypothetical protein HY905_14135 [Deltaproteobacteria bacterium]|nr:hypothetical protein [Deltaproteobacteria bacterium]
MPRTRSLPVVLLPLLAASCGGDAGGNDAGGETVDDAVEESGETAPVVCNGSIHLCDRRYDQVAYPTTHNAMSNADDGWIAPNQNHGITRQLEDGVRALMLDTHDDAGQTMLCHGYCWAGSKPLADGLGEIAAFLEDHPREIVTIIFESYVTAAATAAAFEDAALMDLLFVPPPAGPWPTLNSMIDAGTRLVVFTDNEGGAYPWYLDVWTWAWETDFDNQAPRDFSCARNRGSDGNLLFIFNHFLTNPVADPDLAEQVNYNPLLIDRLHECQAGSGRLPNFVTVDFYDLGDLFAAVDALNAP